ncbi:MAG: rhodanese-like domain-containing protein [Propionibacteriales bacterium]|nr:rhodanese-like domain-containing protein [Propionibacteriales bacterium]
MAAEEIDVEVAHAMWRAGDLVVDVRTPAEYAHGHIAGAVNVPLDAIPLRTGELPPGQIIAVCSMGNRSRKGAETFARAGRTAFSLRGGTKAWAGAGLSLVTGSEPGERERGGPGVLRRLFGRRG